MSRLQLEPLSVGRVIGEVVDNFIPCVKLSVTYNSNKQVSNGHELMPALIMAKPRVEIGGDDLRAAYTLVINIHFLAALPPFLSLSLSLFFSHVNLHVLEGHD